MLTVVPEAVVGGLVTQALNASSRQVVRVCVGECGWVLSLHTRVRVYAHSR